jgi:hypothetical protein
MSRVVVQGLGAVSPAGWGVDALVDACQQRTSLPLKELTCPGYSQPLKACGVPPASPKPAFMSQPRLRRTSAIAQYAVAAALEALGDEAARFRNGTDRLGIVYCSMSGCVNFSRRFYDETLKDPMTASPVIFPETVFNSPASHLGALLGSQSVNYTLIGDPGTFVQGLALAADWLESERVEGCLVVGAEELDWLIAEAFDLFNPGGKISEGAGALYLSRGTAGQASVHLQAITQSHLFSSPQTRAGAAVKARQELGDGVGAALLCDGIQGVRRLDEDENAAWSGWRGERWSPKLSLGEGFMAASAWQCVAAAGALSRGLCTSANVSVVGYNQQAIGARFGKS